MIMQRDSKQMKFIQIIVRTSVLVTVSYIRRDTQYATTKNIDNKSKNIGIKRPDMSREFLKVSPAPSKKVSAK